jgi:endonuclease I
MFVKKGFVANSIGKICLLFCLLLCGVVRSSGQIPSGYYDQAAGLSNSALKTKLYTLINSHTALSYADLWTAFQTTDVRTDGKVWDIYSSATNYVFITNQCGNYSGEGSCYNREHSFPKSWFGGEVAPMYTDLFHLYPSDGYVNGKRSNYPLGNVATVTYSSSNSYSLLGNSADSAGLIVFEPADEMKGDLARTYFYMVTCYENLVASWKSNDNTEMLAGNNYPAFSGWARKMLLEWSRLDPVSDKEIARNNAIYSNFQHNRNPFIDMPQLAEYIWGDSTSYSFQPSKYISALKTSSVESCCVWSSEGCLHVSAIANEPIRIFDLCGRLIQESHTENYDQTFVFESGQLLIVQVGLRSFKVRL